MSITVSQLNVFPIKSIAPISLQSSVVVKTGLENDRIMALSDQNGKIITARENPKLLHVSSQISNESIIITADGNQITIPLQFEGDIVHDLQLFKETVSGIHLSAEVDAFFSAYLEKEVILTRVSSEFTRPVLERRGGKPGDHVAYPDAQPVLLTTTASLRELNSHLDQKVGMDRFRANIVVENVEPYQEFVWKEIRIGEVTFDVVQPCGRCVLTTIDPVSLEKNTSGQPLARLNQYDHNPKGKAVFGVYLIPRDLGQIKVGSALEIMA